jgi:hypothetical protein
VHRYLCNRFLLRPISISRRHLASLCNTRVIRRLGFGLHLGDDFKARKLGDPKWVGIATSAGITTAAHDNTPDAGIVVARVYNIPTAIEKDFSSGAEVHGIGINRDAHVAEIVSAISR